MKSENTYQLPIDKGNILAVASDPRTHREYTSKEKYHYNLKHAVDFLCKEGTLIKSASEGEVVFVQDGLAKNWGNWEIPPTDFMPESEQDGNYIMIKKRNEFSIYSHLANGKIKVKVGDHVKAGQVIAESGNTGWSIKPHLHYMVFKFTQPKPRKDFESLEPTWMPEAAKIIKEKWREPNAA